MRPRLSVCVRVCVSWSSPVDRDLAMYWDTHLAGRGIIDLRRKRVIVVAI